MMIRISLYDTGVDEYFLHTNCHISKQWDINAVYSDLLQCSSGHLNDSKAQISQILITEPKRCCINFTLCLDSCPLGVQCWSIGWPSHHINYLANLKAALRIFKRSEKCWQAQTWNLSKDLQDRRFQGKKFTQKMRNFRHLLNRDKKCVNALNWDKTSKKSLFYQFIWAQHQ